MFQNQSKLISAHYKQPKVKTEETARRSKMEERKKKCGSVPSHGMEGTNYKGMCLSL